jgi:uncharacterized protein (UPF0218 family)
MDEPENHTLRILRDMREEMREMRGEIRSNHAELKESIESLRRYSVGDSVLGRYAAAHVDSHLEALETRVLALEQPR